MAIYCLLMLTPCQCASWRSDKEKKYRLKSTKNERNEEEGESNAILLLQVCELFFFSLRSGSRADNPR